MSEITMNDQQMPSDQEVQSLHQKRFPIVGHHKEKKIFDSADYFMEQDKEKKRGDVDVEVEIDDKAEEHNSDENSPCKHERDRVSASDIAHRPSVNDPETFKEEEEVAVKNARTNIENSAIPSKMSRFAKMN